MSRIFKEQMPIIIFVSVIIAFMIVVLLFGYYMGKRDLENDKQVWNNGYCVCGNKWEYSNTSYDRGRILYHYRCTKCNDVATFSHKVFLER